MQPVTFGPLEGKHYDAPGFKSDLSEMWCIFSLILTVLTAITLVILMTKIYKAGTSLICMSLLSAALFIADIYTTFASFKCFEAWRNEKLSHLLSDYSYNCLFFYIFAIFITLVMIFVVGCNEEDFRFIVELFGVGSLLVFLGFSSFLLPYSEHIDHLVFTMVCLQILAVFIVCPTALIVQKNDEDRRQRTILHQEFASSWSRGSIVIILEETV